MAFLIQYANGVPGFKHELDKTVLTLGEEIDCDLSIPEEGVAAHHAIIELKKTTSGWEYYIRPAGDDEILVNDESIGGKVKLEHEDRIQLGEVMFRLDAKSVCQVSEVSMPEPALKMVASQDEVVKPASKPTETEHAQPVATANKGKPAFASRTPVNDQSARFSRRLNLY